MDERKKKLGDLYEKKPVRAGTGAKNNINTSGVRDAIA